MSRLLPVVLVCSFFASVVPAFAQQDSTRIQAMKDEIALIEKMLPTLPDRAAAQFLLAHDYAGLGQTDRALELIREYVSADEGFDPSDDPEFSSLAGSTEFKSLVTRAQARYPRVAQATAAITVQANDLIPEGLAYDSVNNSFLASSLFHHNVVRVSRSGVIRPIFEAAKYDVGPICGVKVEPPSSSVWAAVCANSGEHAELLHFSRNGRLLNRFPPPGSGKHLFNDFVLHGAKEIFLTDSLANVVYRADRKTHALVPLQLSRDLYYPNGIALSGDNSLLYIADAFGIVVLDLHTGRSHELAPGPGNTVATADGLYWYRNTLVAVQNGMGANRIAQFHLSQDGFKVVSTDILEARTDLVTLPTTGAVVGSDFYFIANSQIDNLRDGHIVDPAKLRNVVIARVPLAMPRNAEKAPASRRLAR